MKLFFQICNLFYILIISLNMKRLELVGIFILGILLWIGGIYLWQNWGQTKFIQKQIKVTTSNAKSNNKEQQVDSEVVKLLNELDKQFKEIVKWKTYVQIIKDKNYQDWVKTVNQLIEKYKSQGKEDIVNYIYYTFIPQEVLKYLSNFTDLEKDLVIQSIRRIDFNTLTDKNYITQLMKDYVDEKYYKPILKELSGIDAKRLDTDINYFRKIMLDPQNWIFYRIFKNRYDWNKTWIGFKPEFLENQFVDFLSQRFEQILGRLWYDKNWFKKKVFEYYNINSLKELADLIRQDYLNIKQKYNLDKLGIPTDRFFRMDERRFLFKEDGLHSYLYKTLEKQWKLNEFKKDIKEFRLKMYLLSYLWKDINLFNHKVRANFIDPELGPGIQNLFRVWRYVDEVMKLDLNIKEKVR